MPAHMRYAFFIEGGALGVENALKTAFDWKVRRNRAKGIPGEQGPAGDPLPAGLPRPHAATRCRSPTPTRARPTSSRSSPGRGSRTRACASRVTPEVERDVARGRAAGARRDRAGLRRQPRRHRGDPDRADPGRGRRHPLPPGVPARAAAQGARARRASSSSTRCRPASASPARCGRTSTSASSPTRWRSARRCRSCGCMVGPRVDEEPENVFKVSSRINSTWGGGLTDMVRGARYLEIIHEDRLRRERARGRRAAARGPAWRSSTSRAASCTNARGLGLMIAFDLRDARSCATAPRSGCSRTACCCSAAASRSIRFRPPLNLTAAEADTALDLVRKSLKELYDDRARSDGQDQQRAAREPARRGQGRERPAGPDLPTTATTRSSLDAPGRQLHDTAARSPATVIIATQPESDGRGDRGGAVEGRRGRSGWLARSRSRSPGSGRWARRWPAPCSQTPGLKLVAAADPSPLARRAATWASVLGLPRKLKVKVEGRPERFFKKVQRRRGVRLHLVAAQGRQAAGGGARRPPHQRAHHLRGAGPPDPGARGGVQGARPAREAQEGLAARDRRQPRLRDGRAGARAHRSLRARAARVGDARGRRGGAQAARCSAGSAPGSTSRSSAAPSPRARCATWASSSRRT